MGRGAAAPGALPVPRSGGGTHSYVFVPDAAAATVAALERGRADSAYNVCDDRPTAWNDFFDAAAAAVGAPRPLRVPGWVFRATPYAVEDGCVSIPSEPGWGVEIEPEWLAKAEYRVSAAA